MSSSPFRFDSLSDMAECEETTVSNKRTKREIESAILDLDQPEHHRLPDAFLPLPLNASSSLLLESLATIPHLDELEDSIQNPNNLLHHNDEDDEDFLSETILTILDPIQSVACKSIHKAEESELGPGSNSVRAASVFYASDQAKHAVDEDRLTILTDDLVLRITSYLNASDLVHRFGMLNRQYHEISETNHAGWDGLYQGLQATKCHVSPLHANTSSMKTAYRLALADSQRQHITLEELCYNLETGTGTIWSFRFKESAGSDWTAHDPWYSGAPCRKIIFLQDSTMKQVVTVPSSTAAAAPLSAVNSVIREEMDFVDPPARMTWRFLTRPMDLPTRPVGSYVRIQVAGRDVPTYAVRRSPTGNWGFVLESCWGIYGSFELPPRLNRDVPRNENAEQPLAPQGPPQNADPLGTRRRLATTAARAAEMQDESMTLTNEVQWREAFLYNVGARILPEGDAAIDEFDRFWQGAA
jgi:hypothetical protein